MKKIILILLITLINIQLFGIRMPSDEQWSLLNSTGYIELAPDISGALNILNYANSIESDLFSGFAHNLTYTATIEVLKDDRSDCGRLTAFPNLLENRTSSFTKTSLVNQKVIIRFSGVANSENPVDNAKICLREELKIKNPSIEQIMPIGTIRYDIIYFTNEHMYNISMYVEKWGSFEYEGETYETRMWYSSISRGYLWIGFSDCPTTPNQDII